MARYFESRSRESSGWLVRPGLISTVYGLIVASLLASAALLGSRISDGLEDPTQSLHPPHLEFAQAILFDPLDRCGYQPLFGDTSNPDSDIAFTSSPDLTSVVGKLYQYHPSLSVLDGAEEKIRIDVEDGPVGFEVSDSGDSFEWTPERVGAFCVTVSARSNGAAAYQTFEVFASQRAHPLGTDRAGRDMVLALAAGARWALLPGLIMAILAIGLGTVFGGLGGYYGGSIEVFFEFLTSVTASIPGLLLLFLVAVLSAFNVYVTIAALAVLWMPRTASAVRTSVIDLKNRDFVEACRELGQSDAEILWREIIWANDRNQLLAQFFQAVGFAIVIEVTISYLGLGVKLPDISWGVLLKEGRDMAIQANIYWIVVVTALTVLVSVHGLNSLGRGVIALLGREGS